MITLILSNLLLLANSPSARAIPTSTPQQSTISVGRERIRLNTGWRFLRVTTNPDNLIYDERPKVTDRNDNIVADTKPTESSAVTSSEKALKRWILPSANEFISDPTKRHKRPAGSPGSDFPFVQQKFDDRTWEAVTLPHDWAINGPFYTETNAIIGGGMGRLPVQGVGWYRRKLAIATADKGKSIYLDIDGAMSYAMVWLNGNLVGGWPYGYNSFRLDLTPYVKPGNENQLAIRLDNPTNSSRWYPGGGIYRTVWLTKVNPTHVAQWGTFITSKEVSTESVTFDLAVQVENKATANRRIEVVTDVHLFDSATERIGKKVGEFPRSTVRLQAGQKQQLTGLLKLKKPLLWEPLPTQHPNLYVAITRLYADGKEIDTYETKFGIRSLTFDSIKGTTGQRQTNTYSGRESAP